MSAATTPNRAKVAKGNPKIAAAPESGVRLTATAMGGESDQLAAPECEVRRADLDAIDVSASVEIAVDSVTTVRRALDAIYSAWKNGSSGDWAFEYVEGCQAAFLAFEELENIATLSRRANEGSAEPAETSAPVALDSGVRLAAASTGEKDAPDFSDAGWCLSLSGEALKFTRKAALSLVDANAAARSEGAVRALAKIDDAMVWVAYLRDNLQTSRKYARDALDERAALLARIDELENELAGASKKGGAR